MTYRLDRDTYSDILTRHAEWWTEWQVWGSRTGFNGQPFPVANTLTGRV